MKWRKIKTSEVLQAGGILVGRKPSLSIEITKECPLLCPGCYAFDPAHLGGKSELRQLSDFQGDQQVRNILAIVGREKPLHLSLVAGDPLVRYREVELLLPELEKRGIHTQIVTSAFRVIPIEWNKLTRLNIVVSIDVLQADHDERRRPATYERILKNIAGTKVVSACSGGKLSGFLRRPLPVPDNSAFRIFAELSLPTLICIGDGLLAADR